MAYHYFLQLFSFMHCKKISDFPIPRRDVTNQTLAGNN
jgi:hypothetical protein